MTEIGTVIDGKYSMHMVVGQGKNPGKWEEAGWAPPAPQLPSLEVFFESGASEDFIRNVMSQHYIVTYGDNMALIEDYAAINGLKIIR